MKILFDVTDITKQRKFMSNPQYKLRLLKAFSFKRKRTSHCWLPIIMLGI